MTRAQQNISQALLATSVYLAFYLELIPTHPLVVEQILPVLPFWFLVSYGAYLLFRLGWHVATFRDVPEAMDELMEEIKVAKTELRQMAVEVD